MPTCVAIWSLRDIFLLMSPTILVADDNLTLRSLIDRLLRRAGYNVHLAANGYEVLAKLRQHAVDLILLDVMMPQMDGFAVCTEIRKRSDVPIILVTALDQSDDVVRGFTLGADDFVTKPFFFRELLARVKAVLRRRRPARAPIYGEREEAPIVLDPAGNGYEVRVNDRTVSLTRVEYDLLRYLMARPDHVVSKAELLRDVWAYGDEGDPNIVEVGVLRLRNKIEPDPSAPVFLRTVRGRGYRFSIPTQAHGS